MPELLSILYLTKTLLPQQHHWELLVQTTLVQAWIIYQPLSWELQYCACIYTHNNNCNFMVPHPTPFTFSIILSRCISFFFATKKCSALLTSSYKPQRSSKAVITLNLTLCHGW